MEVCEEIEMTKVIIKKGKMNQKSIKNDVIKKFKKEINYKKTSGNCIICDEQTKKGRLVCFRCERIQTPYKEVCNMCNKENTYHYFKDVGYYLENVCNHLKEYMDSEAIKTMKTIFGPLTVEEYYMSDEWFRDIF